MKSKLKAVCFMFAVVAVGFLSGCGGGGGSTTSDGASASPSASPSNSPPASTADGAALYAANCAGCHGALANSVKTGITLFRLQNAIATNVGNMSFLSTLTSAQQQAIVTALNPGSTPTPTTTPTSPQTPAPTVDGAALYAANCAGCHGVLASSGKKGITLARLQTAISGNTGNMGFLSTLTSAQQQAIVTALAPAATTPTPPPATTPPVTDGATLYATDCAGCHGALASSAKAGATASRIQTAINGNTGGMGSLSTLTSTQVSAIATVLAGVTAPSTPPPTAACGSCHAIPPATGKHNFHTNSEGVACATCHGSGYSTTTVNAATHNNGVKNMATTIGWNSTSRSCSNSCHGSKRW